MLAKVLAREVCGESSQRRLAWGAYRGGLRGRLARETCEGGLQGRFARDIPCNHPLQASLQASLANPPCKLPLQVSLGSLPCKPPLQASLASLPCKPLLQASPVSFPCKRPLQASLTSPPCFARLHPVGFCKGVGHGDGARSRAPAHHCSPEVDSPNRTPAAAPFSPPGAGLRASPLMDCSKPQIATSMTALVDLRAEGLGTPFLPRAP